MSIRRHPKDSVLSQFVDGRLAPARHQRVVSHLAQCARCRAEVELIRKTGELARSLEPRPAPSDAIDQILQRRARGERVLLPTEGPGRVQEPRTTPWRMIAAALVGLFMVGLLFTDLLEADRQAAFQIEPERPEAGEVLSFTYDDGTRFQELDRLLLRARYNAASGARWQEVGAILVRGENGLFKARLELPDSAVYAEFAVESPDGETSDLYNGAPWEVLFHEPDGRPSLEGLTGRVGELYRRGNKRGIMESAAQMEVHYPASPRSVWASLLVEAATNLTPDRRAEVQAQLREFERQFAQTPPEHPDDLAYLAWVAFVLEDIEGGRIWLDLARRNGARGVVVDQAIAALTLFDDAAPETNLALLEQVWQDRSHPVLAVASRGLDLALETEDWDATVQWYERRQAARVQLTFSLLLDDLRQTFGAEMALKWGLEALPSEMQRMAAGRPLERTTGQYQRLLDAERQSAVSMLADMALETGRLGLAEQLAREATPLSWETRDLERAGKVLLATGDTSAAVVALARAAASPAAEPIPRAVTERDGWVDKLDTARQELRNYVIQGRINRPLPRPIAAELQGEVTVVAFVSSCEGLRHVARVDSILPTPVRVFTDYDEQKVFPAIADCDAPIRPESDPDGEWRAAFNALGLPYFVTDSHGRVRFQHARASEVLRQVDALLGPEPVPATIAD